MALNTKKLNASGYNCKFVSEPPDSYICKICTFVAKDPQQMDCCGKDYCRLCLTEHKKHSNKCPQCREAGNSFNDMRVKLEIQALKVKCDNLVNGCQWDGELLSLEGHVENCDHVLLPCPNECKKQNETVIVLRKDLNNHLANECPKRKYQCPHCGEMGEYEESSEHIEACANVKIQCPNDQCYAKLKRSALALHRYTCNYEKLPCKYEELGCEERPLRKELKKHEDNDRLHFRIITETVFEYKHQIQQLRQENIDLRDVVRTRSREKFTFMLTSFTGHREHNKIFYSRPFYSNQNGYKFCIRVDANGYSDFEGEHVSVYACLMRGEQDNTLSWPFTGTVKFELLNHLEDSNHHMARTSFPADSVNSKRVTKGDRNVGLGKYKFIAHSALDYNSAKNCQYLKDDKLFFRVSVDMPNYKPWLECT